eukprot:Gregarina_sp_Pseudo_9__5958@NODE_969_length_2019_cov_54_007576_g909_i0_p1_GENE_NODE_969_length_2019_cov_54_007576_g909_i0NODE_969_length_2019_cov_54_007576_g909_i0_p1_ORF_typecomplete_len528_score138_73MscS_porin/PF12795_7/0_033DUF4140/PF13600_6/0_059ZapB/PF06005_12/0_5_NODE_969_length_2019_cov_54_007576_g909_i01781761
MDFLPISKVRSIASSLGYYEQRQNVDCSVFYRHAEGDGTRPTHPPAAEEIEQTILDKLPQGSRVFPACVEVYSRTGDVVTYLPHPRQRAYRIFHFGALYSAETVAEIFRSPWNDLQFSYRLSELLAHPRDAVPPAPPPQTAVAALERQLAILEREMADIRSERSEVRRRLRSLQRTGDGMSIGYDESDGCLPQGASLSLVGGDSDCEHGHRSLKDTDKSSSIRNSHRKGYSARQHTPDSNAKNSGRQPLSSTDRENMSVSHYDAKTREDGGESLGRLNVDRMRGNKGIWNMFFPDAKEEFARAWNLKPVNLVSLGRGYVISYDDGSVTWSDICPLLEAKLRQQGLVPISTLTAGKNSPLAPVQIKYLVLGSESNFYVKFDNGRMEWCGQDGFGECLRRGVNDKRLLVERVAFGQNGSWIVLWSDGTYDCEGLPPTLHDRLRKSRTGTVLSPSNDGRSSGVATGIKDITVGPTGEWFIIYKDHSVQADNLPDALYKSLSQIRERSGRVRSIVFGENRSWFVRFWDGSK